MIQRWNIVLIIMFSLVCNQLKVRVVAFSLAHNELFKLPPFHGGSRVALPCFYSSPERMLYLYSTTWKTKRKNNEEYKYLK